VSARRGHPTEAEVDGHRVRIMVREGSAGAFQVQLDERVLEVDACPAERGFLSVLVGGESFLAGVEARAEGYSVTIGHAVFEVTLTAATDVGAPARTATGPARLKAPMPGKIVRVLVELGASVAAAQGLVVMEAMKMENELRSPRAGRVRALHVREGQTVEAGQAIADVE